MINKLDTFLSAAEYAKEQSLIDDVKLIKDLSEKNNYLVSFMGQFSAGKSRLLNNLLGREILPVHGTETTPIVTFIRYGEDEKATVRYCDGREADIEVGEVAEIWQDSNKADEYGLIDIVNIEIFLKEDMLKNGLILADTPGINTIISSHEEITTKLLGHTEELFFVTAKSVTDSDMIFMKLVNDIGIKTSVVRTHMDDIKEFEEDVNATIASDKEKYDTLIGKECDCYFLSNNPENKWFMGVAELRGYLECKLANCVHENIIASCELRLKKIEDILKKSVAEKLEMLAAKQDGRRSALEIELEKNKASIKNIYDMFSRKEARIQSNIDSLCRESEGNLQDTKALLVRDCKKTFSNSEYSDDLYERMQHISVAFLENANIKLREAYFSAFNREINTINDQLFGDDDISEIVTDAPRITDLNSLIEQCQEDDIRLREYQNQLVYRKEALERAIAESDDNSVDYEEEIKNLQEEMDSVNQLIAEHGVYSPHYIEVPGDNSVSEGLAKVGSVLDIATLFLPAPTPSKVGIVAKCVKGLSKAKTLITGAKTVKNISKTAKLMNKMKKAVTVGANIARKTAVIQRNVRDKTSDTGILDLVSLEYWGRKIGSKFDTPPKKIEDVEYREQFMLEKRAYEQQRMRVMSAMLDKKRAAGLFRSKQQEEAERRRVQQEEMQKIESYMSKRKVEIEAESRKKYADKICSEWCNWTENQLDILCSNLKLKSKPVFNQAIGDYRKMVLGAIESKQQELVEKEDKIATELSSLNSNEIQQEINMGKKLLNEIRSA